MKPFTREEMLAFAELDVGDSLGPYFFLRLAATLASLMPPQPAGVAERVDSSDGHDHSFRGSCVDIVNGPVPAAYAYRTGRSIGHTLYLDDKCIGFFVEPEAARNVARMLNAYVQHVAPLPTPTPPAAEQSGHDAGHGGPIPAAVPGEPDTGEVPNNEYGIDRIWIVAGPGSEEMRWEPGFKPTIGHWYTTERSAKSWVRGIKPDSAPNKRYVLGPFVLESVQQQPPPSLAGVREPDWELAPNERAISPDARRCAFCGRPHDVSDHVAEESPFCQACLHERVSARERCDHVYRGRRCRLPAGHPSMDHDIDRPQPPPEPKEGEGDKLQRLRAYAEGSVGACREEIAWLLDLLEAREMRTIHDPELSATIDSWMNNTRPIRDDECVPPTPQQPPPEPGEWFEHEGESSWSEDTLFLICELLDDADDSGDPKAIASNRKSLRYLIQNQGRLLRDRAFTAGRAGAAEEVEQRRNELANMATRLSEQRYRAERAEAECAELRRQLVDTITQNRDLRAELASLGRPVTEGDMAQPPPPAADTVQHDSIHKDGGKLIAAFPLKVTPPPDAEKEAGEWVRGESIEQLTKDGWHFRSLDWMREQATKHIDAAYAAGRASRDGEVKALTDALNADDAAYARVCSALGIEYVQDQGPSYPGPIEAVLRRIDELKRAQNRVLDAEAERDRARAEERERCVAIAREKAEWTLAESNKLTGNLFHEMRQRAYGADDVARALAPPSQAETSDGWRAGECFPCRAARCSDCACKCHLPNQPTR